MRLPCTQQYWDRCRSATAIFTPSPSRAAGLTSLPVHVSRFPLLFLMPSCSKLVRLTSSQSFSHPSTCQTYSDSHSCIFNSTSLRLCSSVSAPSSTNIISSNSTAISLSSALSDYSKLSSGTPLPSVVASIRNVLVSAIQTANGNVSPQINAIDEIEKSLDWKSVNLLSLPDSYHEPISRCLHRLALLYLTGRLNPEPQKQVSTSSLLSSQPFIIDLLAKASQLGNADALFSYGNLLAKGLGILANENLAEVLFRKAADKGHMKSASRYGQMKLDKLRGVPASAKKTEEEAVAFRYLKAAADSGLIDAATRISLYCSAPIVEQRADMLHSMPLSLEEVSHYLRLAADKEEAVAQYLLALLYLLQPLRKDQNPVEAASLLKRAANNTFLPAQARLSMLLFHGLGVERDDASALQWLTNVTELHFQDDRTVSSAFSHIYPLIFIDSHFLHLAILVRYLQEKNVQYASLKTADNSSVATPEEAKRAKMYDAVQKQIQALLERIATLPQSSSSKIFHQHLKELTVLAENPLLALEWIQQFELKTGRKWCGDFSLLLSTIFTQPKS